MHAAARLIVACDRRARSVPAELRCEAPLLMRVTETDDGSGRGLAVHLVGGAAGPLGGDRLEHVIDVGHGATLTVRSVAASLAQPGRVGAGGSESRVHAVVGTGATLDWWPEPVISVRGSEHTQRTTVDIDADVAAVRWVDEVVLGRHAEPGGRLRIHQRISHGGLPVLCHTVTLDPSLDGIGRQGTARVMISGIVVAAAHESRVRVEPGLRMVRYPLTERCTAWIALADDLDTARAGLAELGLDRKARLAQLTDPRPRRDNSLVEPTPPIAEHTITEGVTIA